MYDIAKLRACFPETTVYKDAKITAIFKAGKVEAFLRDWILKRKADENGQIKNVEELTSYVARIIPNRHDKGTLEDEARTEGATRPFLAKVNVVFNSKENFWTFEIPCLGFTYGQTIIEEYIWGRVKDDLLKGAGGWGLVKLGYNPPENSKKKGKFTLLEFKNFCPYRVDLEAFREARAQYDDTEEWMDVVLGAIDYNPDSFQRDGKLPFETWLAKHTMLTRLLPFIQSRVNLIELAPQQTGKSYVFGKVGKYGWLAGGGSMSRAKMFASMQSGVKSNGLVASNDFVAIDEIKSIKFTDDAEMAGILKGYMEDGYVSVGVNRVEGDAGIIFLGNIDVDDMDARKDMLRELPEIFRDSALLQRVHGFVPGRYIPTINPTSTINGWALNSEYFTEIMHLLRSPTETMRYRGLVEELVEVSSRYGDTSAREKEAIMRLCTAYLKLFFPHATPELIRDASFKREFQKYCLNPAVLMQETVLNQMKIVNPNEFGSKGISSYRVRD